MILGSKIAIEEFQNITKPEIAYLLGFLWADGYITKLKKWNSTIVSLEIVQDDFIDIQQTIAISGQWNYYYNRIKNKSTRQYARCTTADKKLYYFLEKMDYIANTNISPNKILYTIPERLQHYWYRGYFDGDGSFLVKKTERRMIFTSCYNQDWEFLIRLAHQLPFNYYIKICGTKKSKWSNFHIGQTLSIQQLGNYIYQNRDQDNIGLIRKYNKFLQIKNFKPVYQFPKSTLLIT